ncbi:MAG: hypothetical protein J1F67_07010 [Muribaculaceae bacterium]|nr:hypothetical protein [Muribaculaceae bacterium]
MKIRFLILVISSLCTIKSFAQKQDYPEVVLTPYVYSSSNTPNANKALEDKLKRIVTKYGLASAEENVNTPFILTAHAIELRKETTATVPPHTAVDLSVTFYVGNGEDGTLFGSCNEEVKGVGNNLDQAYAAAFKKININNPELGETIKEGKAKIISYYEQTAPDYIAKAKSLAVSGNYSEAYELLLQIPSVCSQYSQAQHLLISLVQQESEESNSTLLASARAAWSASPNETGASEATSILSKITNASPKLQAEAASLMKEISNRLQKVEDDEKALQAQREANEHELAMEAVKGATKVAVARAKRPVYRIWWW